MGEWEKDTGREEQCFQGVLSTINVSLPKVVNLPKVVRRNREWRTFVSGRSESKWTCLSQLETVDKLRENSIYLLFSNGP